MPVDWESQLKKEEEEWNNNNRRLDWLNGNEKGVGGAGAEVAVPSLIFLAQLAVEITPRQGYTHTRTRWAQQQTNPGS